MDITDDINQMIQEVLIIQSKISSMKKEYEILRNEIKIMYKKFCDEFNEEKTYNPVYIDRKIEERNKIDEYSKQVEQNSIEIQKLEEELKEKVDNQKQDILNKITDRRTALNNEYDNTENKNLNGQEIEKQFEELTKIENILIKPYTVNAIIDELKSLNLYDEKDNNEIIIQENSIENSDIVLDSKKDDHEGECKQKETVKTEKLILDDKIKSDRFGNRITKNPFEIEMEKIRQKRLVEIQKISDKTEQEK